MKKLSILLMAVLLIGVLYFPLSATNMVTAAPLLQGDVARVWTDKSEYGVGETVTIYFRVTSYPACPIPSAGARLTITKPDSSQVVYDLGEISVDTTYYIQGTAGEPLGRREVLFEAWGICGCY
jgi:hypothetical protein